MWFPEQKHTVAVDKILYRIDKKILYGRKNVLACIRGRKVMGVWMVFFLSYFFVIKFSTILCLLFMDCWQFWCTELFSAWSIFNSTFSNKAILFWNLFCVIVIWLQLVAVADPGFLRPNSLCLVERSLIVKCDLSFLCSVHVAGYRPQTKLREGNIFTPVGHSVHRGGSLSGVYLSRGVSVKEIPRTVTSGRYASYWNAFLLSVHLDHCPSFTPFGKLTRIFSLFFF